MDRILEFFIKNFPSLKTLVIAGPPALCWSYSCLLFAGYLKTRKGIRTGYSRKVFHFLIFFSAALTHAVWGSRGVCLFGAMTTCVIFYAVARGRGNILYEAMAREKDEPHRTYYIVLPYFATLVGGLASNILFGPSAVVGYLVAGCGDAVGEPIGTRFGRHTYRVPSLRSVRAVRSYEGSLAVLVVSTAAVAVGVALLPGLEFTRRALIVIPAIGLASMLVEAISPHGLDNATMQAVPALLVHCFW